MLEARCSAEQGGRAAEWLACGARHGQAVRSLARTVGRSTLTQKYGTLHFLHCGAGNAEKAVLLWCSHRVLIARAHGFAPEPQGSALHCTRTAQSTWWAGGLRGWHHHHFTKGDSLSPPLTTTRLSACSLTGFDESKTPLKSAQQQHDRGDRLRLAWPMNARVPAGPGIVGKPTCTTLHTNHATKRWDFAQGSVYPFPPRPPCCRRI